MLGYFYPECFPIFLFKLGERNEKEKINIFRFNFFSASLLLLSFLSFFLCLYLPMPMPIFCMSVCVSVNPSVYECIWYVYMRDAQRVVDIKRCAAGAFIAVYIFVYDGNLHRVEHMYSIRTIMHHMKKKKGRVDRTAWEMGDRQRKSEISGIESSMALLKESEFVCVLQQKFNVWRAFFAFTFNIQTFILDSNSSIFIFLPSLCCLYFEFSSFFVERFKCPNSIEHIRKN